MRRKIRIVGVLVLTFWSALIASAAVLVWRLDVHNRLNRQLLVAVRTGDRSSALLALAHGADANATGTAELPFWQMIWMAFQGRRRATTNSPTALLLLLGSDCPKGPPLSQEDTLPIVRALLAHRARVDVVNTSEESPLALSLYARMSDVARLLLEHDEDSARCTRGWDMLRIAIYWRNDPAVVRTLVRRGGDLNRMEPTGITPLGVAVQYGDVPMVQCLLDCGADPNRLWRPFGCIPPGLPLSPDKRSNPAEVERLLAAARNKMRRRKTCPVGRPKRRRNVVSPVGQNVAEPFVIGRS